MPFFHIDLSLTSVLRTLCPPVITIVPPSTFLRFLRRRSSGGPYALSLFSENPVQLDLSPGLPVIPNSPPVDVLIPLVFYLAFSLPKRLRLSVRLVFHSSPLVALLFPFFCTNGDFFLLTGGLLCRVASLVGALLPIIVLKVCSAWSWTPVLPDCAGPSKNWVPPPIFSWGYTSCR